MKRVVASKMTVHFLRRKMTVHFSDLQFVDNPTYELLDSSLLISFDHHWLGQHSLDFLLSQDSSGEPCFLLGYSHTAHWSSDSANTGDIKRLKQWVISSSLGQKYQVKFKELLRRSSNREKTVSQNGRSKIQRRDLNGPQGLAQS